MAADLDLYRDREQSFIKHQFLTKYLQAAAFKTLQGHSPTFNFVDAFAGPWRVSDDAMYSDASFDQAINTLESVRVDLGKRGVGGLKIRFCFCEQRQDAVARLREYAASKGRFEIYVFEGAFEDNLDAIAAKLTDGFTFTFIDPTGWNIRNREVFRFLREQNGEFMLNFMSDHINRHAKYHEVEASFGRFLADAEWAEEFSHLPTVWSNERKMLYLMKAAMRSNKVASYLPDFSIMVPKRERVKMRLILGTHSPSGLEVFRDVQEKVEKQELEMRHTLREGDSPQVSLFSSADIAAIQQEQKGVGCKANRARAEEIIVEFLRGRMQAFPGPVFNQAMEEVPIRRKHLNKVLLDMRERGIVHFDIPAPKRVPQPNTTISLA
ncbi:MULTISPECIES: three-Cys-motif partner protein TcmP [Marivita]|uniref:Three-Cys-motif partner protein TcmP n=1 Tax=Marivita cryptomonadis TaxID=505252 RepID=A0A9Q2RZ11_9RHOB|nr:MULTISPECIES: three-Cys-motif partner protein TcmP [Marivita]MCR9168728.1 three-Cys-motif partner protein TcmP [Paracoccaceae bacterium]MBM2321017.1 three-Cys-motif partner protein TcmP [Marivita cryptomonadis]MBM2330598.1 three-Cys-motif partner protein TcmP [Marivita cryptomonadis]MBM2340184.1 three-Cys-motif partner protein TcmP [Marivita cryptomonadis]MBM2344846.1 three-Cys-motif partner protein TcmP [Marivita cryptomonadis]